MGCVGAYCRGILCISWGIDHGLVSPLLQDRGESILCKELSSKLCHITSDWFSQGYPQEWFPSVSSTIGDRYPERSVFQVFIAITSGPRFALVFLFYILTARPNSVLPKLVAGTGFFRTITCGGWTYITSTDDHGSHDIFMVSYLVASIPWTLGCLAISPNNPRAVRYRKIFAGCWFGTLVPLTYFFIQHKVHKVAGGNDW